MSTEITERDKAIAKYRNFFKKFSCPMLESRRSRLSALLLESFLQPHQTLDPCLNSPADLVALIREKDTRDGVIHEALIDTYPTETLIGCIRHILEERLPKQMRETKLCDVLPTRSRKLVLDDVWTRDFSDDGKVASMVMFKFPVLEQDSKLAEDIARGAVDKAAFCGYFLAQEEFEEASVQPISGKKVLLCYMSFEAKYAKIDFELNAQLFHLTTTSALKKINARGVLPKSKSLVFKYLERTYLFSNCDMLDLCQFAMDKAEPGVELVLLKIDSKDLQKWSSYKTGKTRFYVDPKLSSIDIKKPRAIYTYEGIPRSLLDEQVTIFTVDPRSWKPKLIRHAKLSEFR